MDTALVLHNGIDLVSHELELDGLVPPCLGRARREDLDLPLARLRKAAVHVKEVTREDGRLVAAHAGANLDDGVLLVVGIPGDEHDLDLVFESR